MRSPCCQRGARCPGGHCGGDIDNAYALVRPPGHHAIAGEGMGFCIFGNAALAGFYAFETMGMERIAYVDWDVHHGNGTQSAFYDDPGRSPSRCIRTIASSGFGTRTKWARGWVRA